jgi:hypothetical protein
LFAHASRLEAASVAAFRILAPELQRHDAPGSLRKAAHIAARDELRHTRLTGALALRYANQPLAACLGDPPEERTLEAIATENMVEGCVRETYGALVALWQATHSADPVVASVMASIARDEIAHADLAWQVAAWSESRLSRAARHRVDDARAQAFDELERETATPLAPSLTMLAGLPAPENALALVSGLRRELRAL